MTLAWVLFRSQSFGVALAVYRAMFIGGGGASLFDTWQVVLAGAIVAFAIARMLLARYAALPQWPRISWGFQSAALAGLLLALQVFPWAGVSPTFIYFKF